LQRFALEDARENVGGDAAETDGFVIKAHIAGERERAPAVLRFDRDREHVAAGPGGLAADDRAARDPAMRVLRVLGENGSAMFFRQRGCVERDAIAVIALETRTRGTGARKRLTQNCR